MVVRGSAWLACFLDVSERDAGVERGGDERVAEGVWPDWLVLIAVQAGGVRLVV
jgi:hypothetical protein